MSCITAFEFARRVIEARERVLEKRLARHVDHERTREYLRQLSRHPGPQAVAPEQSSAEGVDDIRTSSRFCPACGHRFYVAEMREVELEFCHGCGGVWLDHGELSQLTGLAADLPDPNARSRRSHYTCPVCSERLTARRYLKPHKLWVDECPAGHGIFLEAGELVQALHIGHES